MRISKFMLPAVTVAGALALAGCGGGSSTTGVGVPAASSDTDTDTDTNTTVANSNVLTPYKVPGGFLHANLDDGDDGAIPRGEKTSIGGQLIRGVSNANGAEITCPSTATNGCRWSFENGQLLLSGGATAVRIEPPAVSAPTETASTHWLSAGKIVSAINTGDGGLEIQTAGGATVAIAEASVDRPGTRLAAGTASYETADGSDVFLGNDRTTTGAGHGDFLVWGAWEEKQNGKTVRRTVAGGSVPYTGPTPTTGTATYIGPALGFYKHGSGSWADWRGNARLTANFADGGKISGGIKSTAADNTNWATENTPIVAGHFASVSLKDDGSVAIVGFDSSGVPGSLTTNLEPNAPSSGTWEHDYFGPSNGNRPTGVAGTFAAVRPEAKAKANGLPSANHDAVYKLDVLGSFGAD